MPDQTIPAQSMPDWEIPELAVVVLPLTDSRALQPRAIVSVQSDLHTFRVPQELTDSAARRRARRWAPGGK